MKYNVELTGEQLDIVKEALGWHKDMFIMRVKEATTGAFSPDEGAANEATRSLNLCEETLEACDNAKSSSEDA